MSIRTRVVLSWLLIIGCGFFFLVRRIMDVKEIKPRYMESVEESIVDTAGLLASLVEAEVSAGQLEIGHFGEAFHRAETRTLVAQIFAKRKTALELGLYITDARGIVVFDSDGGRAEGQDYSRWNDVFLTLRGQYGSRSTRLDKDDPLSSTLHVAAPIRAGDRIIGVLSVSKPQRSMAIFMTEARRRIAMAGAFTGVAVLLLGSLASAWLTRPILRLTDTPRPCATAAA